MNRRLRPLTMGLWFVIAAVSISTAAPSFKVWRLTPRSGLSPTSLLPSLRFRRVRGARRAAVPLTSEGPFGPTAL